MNTAIRKLATIALVAPALAALAPSAAQAQQYPNRAIRMICPTAPGGTLDIVCRTMAQKLSEQMGQPMVVENRPGNTSIGEEAASKATPDGYNVVMTGITLATTPYLRSNLGYDAQKDFAPISLVATSGNVLVVHPSNPAKTVKELIEYSKTRGSPMFYGTPSVGSTGHIAAEMFNQAAGTKFQQIPYKGSALALQDLMANQINMTFDNIPVAISHIRSGKIRPIAVTSARRSPQLPDVPTIAESGLPGYQISAWFGLLAPANTPDAAVQRLNAETLKALASADIKERFSNLGFEPAGNSPEEFRRFIRNEYERIGVVVKAAGIKPE